MSIAEVAPPRATSGVAVEVAVVIVVGVAFSRISEGVENYGSLPPVSPAAALAVAAVLLLVSERGVDRPMLPLAVGLMAANLAVVAFSALGAVDLSTTTEALDSQAGSMALLLAIVVLVTTPRRLELALWAVVGATAVVGAANCAQALTGTYTSTFGGLARASFAALESDFGWRLAGPVGDPNFFAQMLVAGVAASVVCAVASSGWPRRLALAAVGSGGVALVLTYSRGGILAIALALALVSVRLLAWRALVVWLALGVAGVALVPAALVARVQGAVFDAPKALSGEVVADSAINGRASEAIVGFEQFSDHWLVGIGVGNYERHYLEYARSVGLDPRGVDRSAHSLVIETMAETGVIGLAVLAAVIVVAFGTVALLRADGPAVGITGARSMAVAVEAALLGHLACALFLHGAYPRGFWVLVALALASGQVALRAARAVPPPPG